MWFLPRDITVYVPFWFDLNLLESMWTLLIKDFRNKPMGLTVRGGLWFYVSYIIPVKVRVFPSECMLSSASSSPDLSYLFKRASILSKITVKSDVEQPRGSQCLLTLACPHDLLEMHFVTKTFQVQAALTLSGHTCGLLAFLWIIPHPPRENDLPILSVSNLLASHFP